MEAKLAVIVVEGRIELVRAVDPTAIDDHHDLFVGVAEGCHHLMDILAQLLRIKVRDDFIEDFGGAILDCPNHTEQHAARDPVPGAMAYPRLAFAQGPRQEAWAQRFAPPARPRQRKAPEDRFVFVE